MQLFLEWPREKCGLQIPEPTNLLQFMELTHMLLLLPASKIDFFNLFSKIAILYTLFIQKPQKYLVLQLCWDPILCCTLKSKYFYNMYTGIYHCIWFSAKVERVFFLVMLMGRLWGIFLMTKEVVNHKAKFLCTPALHMPWHGQLQGMLFIIQYWHTNTYRAF